MVKDKKDFAGVIKDFLAKKKQNKEDTFLKLCHLNSFILAYKLKSLKCVLSFIQKTTENSSLP